MTAKADTHQNLSDFVSVATKISRADKIKLQAIADNMGLNLYSMLQGCMLAFLRAFDTDTQISEEHNRLVQTILSTLMTQGQHSTLTRTNQTSLNVKSAIVFATATRASAPTLLHVAIDSGGKVTESHNTDTMLAELLRATDEKALRHLQEVKRKRGCFSLLQTLCEVLHTASQDNPEEQVEADIREMFCDVRLSTGEVINSAGVMYRRKKNTGDFHQSATPRHHVKADI